jgi:RNA 3'-terminal phosphate cyclase (ATP)
VLAEYENVRAAFTAVGRRGRRAEDVGEEAARLFLRHHRSRACVGPHLADQVLLPLALAGGPSRFTTSAVTGHLRTNAEVLSLFIDLTLRIEERGDGTGLVAVEPEAG